VVKNYIKDSSKPLVLINTHYHWDHVWGNAYVQAIATISHTFCRQMIEEKWDEMLANCSMFIHGQAELKLPDLVFDRELYFPEDGIRLIYTPGHTIDTISILDEKEGVINMGDNIGDNMEQIVPSLYCDSSYYKDTLILYNELDFDTCISGHNRVLGRDVIGKISSLV
jgi:glyoxylase-like metal-dependent hydrolase (beta-lactamase superfamily II)